MLPARSEPMRIDELKKYLEKHLPNNAPSDVEAFVEAVRAEARRYVLNVETLGQPKSNRPSRRQNLQKAFDEARALRGSLSRLDSIFVEDLDQEMGRNSVQQLIGHLARFSERTADLLARMSKTGRPPNVAQERWVYALADLYESNL